jgi:hypothetical protein
MARAVSGAVIIDDWEGTHTNHVLYRQRCDKCRYFSPYAPFWSTRLLAGRPGVYGTYHLESFVCPFCGNRQVVRLEG